MYLGKKRENIYHPIKENVPVALFTVKISSCKSDTNASGVFGIFFFKQILYSIITITCFEITSMTR